MEINNSVAAWSAGLAAQRLPRWDELPDIDLYLDQVLTLLDKYLGPFLPENGGHALTASMINNYVKLRIVPAPVKKRYGRVQLAYLLVIGLLKQVLPIPDVKTLLESQFEGGQAARRNAASRRLSTAFAPFKRPRLRIWHGRRRSLRPLPGRAPRWLWKWPCGPTPAKRWRKS